MCTVEKRKQFEKESSKGSFGMAFGGSLHEAMAWYERKRKYGVGRVQVEVAFQQGVWLFLTSNIALVQFSECIHPIFSRSL